LIVYARVDNYHVYETDTGNHKPYNYYRGDDVGRHL